MLALNSHSPFLAAVPPALSIHLVLHFSSCVILHPAYLASCVFNLDHEFRNALPQHVMSFQRLFTPFARFTGCTVRPGSQLCQLQPILPVQHAVFKFRACFKSDTSRPSSGEPVAPACKPTPSDISAVQGQPHHGNVFVKEASVLQRSLREYSQSLDTSRHVGAAEIPNKYPVDNAFVTLTPDQRQARDRNVKSYKEARTLDSKITNTTKKPLTHKERVAKKRRQVLWPGLWTLFTLAGTYGALAYLDVKAGIPSSDGSHLAARVQLPQNWSLTPEIIHAGLVAAWNELDGLTVSIVVVSTAIHLLLRSKPSIWKKLVHVPGEAKWTAFTYPLVHPSWKSLAGNMITLTWFLPSVVYYFDGDLFHAAAFLASVPLTTSYLMHFAYRFNLIQATASFAGTSGLSFAILGVYCTAYAREKLWLPVGLILRSDAWHWGVLFWVSQACRLALSSNTERRYVIVVRNMSV